MKNWACILGGAHLVSTTSSVSPEIRNPKPDHPEAYNNLGTTLYRQDRPAEAIRQFQEALRLKPGFADARRNLAAVLAAQANPSPPPGTATNR